MGVQIATGSVEAGVNVVLCSRKKEACDEVASQIEKLGGRALSFKCDITNPSDVQEVVNETYREFGATDILVNNSGASLGALAVDMPLEAWQKVVNVNVTGTFIMSQTVGRIMKAMILRKLRQLRIATRYLLKGSMGVSGSESLRQNIK